MTRPLYISYDGALDQLGSSQIVPYLKKIAFANGGAILISFEKPEYYKMEGRTKKSEFDSQNIIWLPLSFTTSPRLLGKAWDLIKMVLAAIYIGCRHKPKVIHARGQPAAQAGLVVKKLIGAKLIFDFRGLWADERVDKGGWNLSKPLHRMQYAYFKRKERTLLATADQVVILTSAAKQVVHNLGARPASKVTVIPCCADFEHFLLADQNERARARAKLNLPQNSLVLGYLGSTGRMYRLDRVLRLFEISTRRDSQVHLLLVTRDDKAVIQLLDKHLPTELHTRVRIYSASRPEMPQMIAAMDISVSFIQPSYARVATSPTKLAESFAVGVPVIANAGVGDVEHQIERLRGGLIVDPESEDDLRRAASQLGEIAMLGGEQLRDAARPILGLELAHERYAQVYSNLDKSTC